MVRKVQRLESTYSQYFKQVYDKKCVCALLSGLADFVSGYSSRIKISRPSASILN